jgi:hypothetical protein
MSPAPDPCEPQGRRIPAGRAGPGSDASDGRDRAARRGPAPPAIVADGDAESDDILAPDGPAAGDVHAAARGRPGLLLADFRVTQPLRSAPGPLRAR